MLRELIEVKYFDKKMIPLKFIEDKSDWIDLRVGETIELKKGEFKLIPLGVAIKLPYGYEAHIAPRGSTFKNFGVIQTNSVGVVDYEYQGNDDQWFMPVYAMRDTLIEFNDRICQFRIMENMPQVKIETVNKLKGVNRGGHGSTGVK